MVNYEDGGSIYIHFGCHFGPMDGFDCHVMIRGVCYSGTLPFEGLRKSHGAKYFVPVVG